MSTEMPTPSPHDDVFLLHGCEDGQDGLSCDMMGERCKLAHSTLRRRDTSPRRSRPDAKCNQCHSTRDSPAALLLHKKHRQRWLVQVSRLTVFMLGMLLLTVFLRKVPVNHAPGLPEPSGLPQPSSDHLQFDKTPRTAISAFNPLPCSKKGTMILSVTTRLSTFFVPSDNAAHELSPTNMFKSFTYTVTSADVKCGPFPVIWQP